MPRDHRPSPYSSARDLPSYQELDRQLQGFKMLTRFFSRKQHSELERIEQELNHLTDVVDRFYERLGSRNWIFHELLGISVIEAILDQTDTSEEAEQRFVEIYRDKKKLAVWIHRLRGVEGLRERAHQIDRAHEHYSAEQFDSTVLQLLAVMDGFVNDFEPEQRRGVASREPDSMTAWDSVVGHHMGLTNALKAFTKTSKKRMDEEVYELHRHGIVHGAITRFDNVIIATKAWNMLFALADWAAATTKARQPDTPKPTLRGIVQEMMATTRLKAKLEVWEPSHLAVSDAQFENHEIHRLTVEFLTAWRERNFGGLARFPSKRLGEQQTSSGQMAGRLRERFEGFDLSQFRVTELEHPAPVRWLARGEATVNGISGAFECRWICEEDDGSFGYGSDSALWRLVFCDPAVWRMG